MKRRHVLLAAGLVVAAGLALLGDRTAQSEVAEPVVRAPAPGAGSRPARDDSRAAAAGPAILAVVPRAAPDATTLGESAGDAALFRSQDWTPPPPPPAVVPAPAPRAPALPFTYIGKAASDGQWQVFLASGERTLVVHANEIIDGTYRVDAIAPPLLTITYLPLKQVQQLNIGVID